MIAATGWSEKPRAAINPGYLPEVSTGIEQATLSAQPAAIPSPTDSSLSPTPEQEAATQLPADAPRDWWSNAQRSIQESEYHIRQGNVVYLDGVDTAYQAANRAQNLRTYFLPNEVSTAVWQTEGNQAGAWYGSSVASAGDVNGDGYDDIIVGAPGYDNGNTDEGAAFVYLGSASGLSATAAWREYGDHAYADYGYSVASAEDVNGDGYDDVIVGARWYHNSVDLGAAFLFDMAEIVSNQPLIVINLNTTQSTGDSRLEEHDITAAAITRLHLTFSKEVFDPADHSDFRDVTNPANYLLVRDGADGSFSTDNCVTGIAGDDEAVSIDSVSYDMATRTSTVTLNGGNALAPDSYRFLACGSTSIQDVPGRKLDGNFDFIGGDDYLHHFTIKSDADGDTVFDDVDNCLNDANTDQADNDGDNLGDVCDADDDNDGMTDAYEITYSLDPNNASDASQDPDLDGYSNLEEFNAGTSPRSNLDYPGKAPVTHVSVPSGVYSSVQHVSLSCDAQSGHACAATYYTLDGATPTTASAVYSNPITIAATTTLKFFSKDIYDNQEVVRSVEYIIDAGAPVVSITSPVDGATLTTINLIEGTTLEAGTGVQKVEIQLTDGTNYWRELPNGQLIFSAGEAAWVEATDTSSGSDWSTWTYPINLNLTSGAWYTVTARATDQAGAKPNMGVDSAVFSLSGDEAYTELSIGQLSSHTLLQGGTVDVSGKLTRLPENGLSLAGRTITLQVTDPGDNTVSYTTTTYDSLGHFRFEDIGGFLDEGSYALQAVFARIEGLLAANQSAIHAVTVDEEAGYAILVRGSISNNEGLDSHNKTAKRIYHTLLERGFDDSNIFYFNYNTTQDANGDGTPDNQQAGIGVDAIPTKAGVQDKIENWLKERVNGLAAPMYFILVDHGDVDTFHIDDGIAGTTSDDTITAEELNTWLTTLEGELDAQARLKPRTLIYGACYSGSFIPILTKQFVPRSLDAVNSAGGFFDIDMQHPLLDDNGDGVGSNRLDGLLAADLRLGIGLDYDTNSVTNPADIQAVSSIQYVEPGSDSALLWLEDNLNGGSVAAWLEVRSPDQELTGSGGTSTIQLTNELDRVLMNFNESTGRWEGTYQPDAGEGHLGFDAPGRYQIYYFVRDAKTGEISPLKQSTVYKRKAVNTAPDPFDLLSPLDDSTHQSTLVFDWQSTTDPDGDLLTYNLVIATDPSFVNVVYRQNVLTTSHAAVDENAGLEDLSNYYWKVEAVDAYGALTPSNQIWWFHTDNTNGNIGILKGLVYSDTDFALLTSANISLSTGVQTSLEEGGFVLTQGPSQTAFILTVSASGYEGRL